MKKKLLSLALGTYLLASPLGCLLTDIGGWDLSACVEEDFTTCFVLFSDNQEQILGGQSVIDIVIGELK